MIRELIFNQLSQAINHILASDPLAFEDLKKLADKTLFIELLPFKSPIYVLITPGGIQLKTRYDKDISVSLRGKPSALYTFVKSPDQTKMLMDEQVTLHGEIDLLLKLKQIAARTQLDIEGLIAETIGDTAANRLCLFAKKWSTQAKDSFHSLTKSTTLYLQEERQLLPSTAEVEQYIKDVNQLRQDLDRLQARSARLTRGVLHV